MEAILVKVFATALALSLVMTRPDAVKTEFDPVNDKAEVLKILGDGCDHMRKAFDIENIDLDDLIEVVMTDKQAAAGEIAGFKGIKFNDLHLAYKQFCKHEKISKEVVNIGEVIEFYNRAAADLPDHTRLKGLKLPEHDHGDGRRRRQVRRAVRARQPPPVGAARRKSPKSVQKAFLAAEDKRFYEHKGVDVRSVIRAFMNTMGGDKRQGGSTITQQVAKNLLVGDSVTFERKIREVIVAARVEKAVSKQEILEIYLNSIYLGRSSWGVELAARSYFGKPVKDVDLNEGAFLAGLTKGPAYFNPDKYRDRAQGRLAYVLTRMKDDGVDHRAADERGGGEPSSTSSPNNRRAPRHRLPPGRRGRPRGARGRRHQQPDRQRPITCARPSARACNAPPRPRCRTGWRATSRTPAASSSSGAETNIGDAIRKLEAERRANPANQANQAKPSWQVALEQVRMPLYDVHWTRAVVVETPQRSRAPNRSGSVCSTAASCRCRPGARRTRSRINLSDVVYVKVVEGTGQKGGPRVELRSRPHGAGRGAGDGEQDRPHPGDGRRLLLSAEPAQPRHAVAPPAGLLVQAADLSRGADQRPAAQHADPGCADHLSADRRRAPLHAAKDWWSPRNYDGGYAGSMTLRRALEQSKNLVTARLLDGGIASTPKESLDAICELAVKSQIYPQCVRYYPFVLGAQPVRPIDLAAFYAAIANEGRRPTPHVIEQI